MTCDKKLRLMGNGTQETCRRNNNSLNKTIQPSANSTAVDLLRWPEMMMKTTYVIVMFLLVAILPSTGHAGTNAAGIVRSLIQPKRYIHESTRGTPVSWSFWTNGTFSANALTGLASWSATGEWKELPNGSVLVEGTQANARKPDERPTAFRRVIASVEVLETRDDFDICLFTYEDDSPVIPVSVRAQAELAVFKPGKPLLMSVTISNGLSKPIRFTTFSTKPTEWNGETMNISLVDVYRNNQKRNLYLSRPQVKVPDSISGPVSNPIQPGEKFQVIVDISRWNIDGGWVKGKYELVFRMDGVRVDEKITMSVLSDPVHVVVQ